MTTFVDITVNLRFLEMAVHCSLLYSKKHGVANAKCRACNRHAKQNELIYIWKIIEKNIISISYYYKVLHKRSKHGRAEALYDAVYKGSHFFRNTGIKPQMVTAKANNLSSH